MVRRKLSWWAWLLLPLLILVAVWLPILALKSLLMDWKDGRVVAVVEPLLAAEFRRLPADSEIVKVFGPLQSLTGEGFRHPTAWVLVDRIDLERTARFEKGWAQVSIHISGDVTPDDPLRFSFTRWPDDPTMHKPGFSGPFYEKGQVVYRFENPHAPGGVNQMPYTVEVWVTKATASVPRSR